jgi:hypothetical protein
MSLTPRIDDIENRLDNALGSGIVYIKDVKANNTAGGTATAGSYQTRTLNTLEGDTSFVSLASNQFTLQPGTYHIEATAPAYQVQSHKAKLRNITNSTDVIIGKSSVSWNNDNINASSTLAVTDSQIVGTFTISASTTFEIQHRVSFTFTTFGFGAASNFGDSEVYTQVKIVKVGA